jgi:hypothetical protein
MVGMKKINVKMELEPKNVTLLELIPKDTLNVSTLNSKKSVFVELPCFLLLEILVLMEELTLTVLNPTLTHLSQQLPHLSPQLELLKSLMLPVKPTYQQVDHLDVNPDHVRLGELNKPSASTQLTLLLEEDFHGLPQCLHTKLSLFKDIWLLVLLYHLLDTLTLKDMPSHTLLLLDPKF